MTDSGQRERESIVKFFARHAGPATTPRGTNGSTFAGIDAIPSGGGQHRNALLQLTGFARRWWMLTPEKAALLAKAAIDAGLLENYNPAEPFTHEELETMARSVKNEYHVSADPEYGEEQTANDEDGPKITTVADSIVGGIDELKAFDQPLEWVIHRYVPRNALVMLYGDGAVGKSTFAAYLTGKQLERGTNVLFVGAGEETPEVFFAKARASMLSTTKAKTFWFLKAANFRLPWGAMTLEAVIRDKNIKLVYFDAWRAHIDHARAEGHEADMTRSVLAPLADLASRCGITVLCTTHENVAGKIMGSSEVRNVARVVLHLTEEDQGFRHIKVTKSNFPKSKGTLRFRIEGTPMIDHLGNVQTEIVDGAERSVEVGYIKSIEISEYPSINVDDVAESGQERIAARIRALREANPAITKQDCLDKIRGSRELCGVLFDRDCQEDPCASAD